jgi:DNA-binding GntR family transcriptional regulator
MGATKTVYDDLGTKVYEILKEMIVKGELKPGQKLIQENLAEILGVSRTPLLQALSKLSKDHYIITVPRRGSFVKEFSNQENLDIFDIRGSWSRWGLIMLQNASVFQKLNICNPLIDEWADLVKLDENR